MNVTMTELGVKTGVSRPRRAGPWRGRSLLALAISAGLHAAVLTWLTLSGYAPPVGVRDPRAVPRGVIEVDLLAGPAGSEAPPSASAEANPSVAAEAVPSVIEANPSAAFAAASTSPVSLLPPRVAAGPRVIERVPGPVTPSPAVPASTLRAFRGAPLPLIGSGSGIRRRESPPDPRRIARARAESLLMTRLAGMPGTERRDPGAIGLTEGGVRVAVPWGGFTRSDRTDGAWRKKRCGGGERDGDKPGEKEARAGQC